MTTQTLINISTDMLALDDLIAQQDTGVDDPAVKEILAGWAREIVNNMEGKVDNYAALLTILGARADARKTESKRLAERARIDENTVQRLKEHLKGVLEFHGIKKLETARYTLTVAQNGGKQAVECELTAEKMPKEFVVQTISYSIDKDKVRESLLAGAAVPGCQLTPRGTNLRIK